MDFGSFGFPQQQKSAPSAPPEAATKRPASGLDAVYDFFQGFVTGAGGQAGPLNGGLPATRFNLPWGPAFMGGATGTSAATGPASSTTENIWPNGAVGASWQGVGGSATSRGMVPQPGQFDRHPFEEPIEKLAPWNDEELCREREPVARSPAPWADEGIREEPMVSGLDPRWGLEVDVDVPRGITSPLPTVDGRGGLTPQRSLSPARSVGRSPRRGQTPTRNGRSSAPGSYEADQDDLLDQHVAYYLRHHPDVHAKHLIARKRPGTYQIDDREVSVEWQYASEPGGQGFLVALDGPLRQPFSDYMEMSENNAEWDNSGGRSSLSMIPRDKRMSFHDQHKVYTRLEAMKVAKEQALVREKHADYVKDGKEAPSDLMHMYKKSIQQKLGQRQRHSSHMTPPAPPAPSPEFPGDPSTVAGPGRPRRSGGHGGPGDRGGPGRPGGAPGNYTPPPPPPPGAYPPWSGGPGTHGQQPGLMPPNFFGPPGLPPGAAGGWGPMNYSGGPGYSNRWPG